MKNNASIYNKKLLLVAFGESFKKLNPRDSLRSPVIFLTLLGAVVTTLGLFVNYSFFDLQITIWLWLTVLFANFSESLAEGRGKAQADSLKKSKSNTIARLLTDEGESKVNATELKLGDFVVCETGDIIPGDGEVVEGIATVDESAITGESAPVVRESGGDRSAVTGGTRVLSDRIVIKIMVEQGDSFIDRMVGLVEGAKRQRTPNELALSVLLLGLSFIFILVVGSLKFYAIFYNSSEGQYINTSITMLVGLFVCLIPTTIGGLLSAIGISGMDRLIRKNVIAKSGKAVEAAGDVDVLLLDKTGTITLGNRMASDFIPAAGVEAKYLAEKAQLASLSDETPEGRSIVILSKEKFGIRVPDEDRSRLVFVPFSASTRMSGVDITTGQKISIRKGAADAILKSISGDGGTMPESTKKDIVTISQKGGTPLVVTENSRVLGVIYLKDIVKGGIKERFAELRKMGIKTVMITGDNQLTAAAIAAEAGVDDFMAEATPETKLKRIKSEQENGHMVAMTGDGTNDAPALAQADVGVAMNTGTQAAREAGNMVDLDSNPTKLIEIVNTGKQLLMTRGALTTFSVANDIAKYFAILPALFAGLYATNLEKSNGPLVKFNIMELTSPQSAMLSAVIFNAIIIILLVPLALKGVKYKATSSNNLLRKNLLIYGLGGLVVPFIGIKLINLFLNLIGLV